MTFRPYQTTGITKEIKVAKGKLVADALIAFSIANLTIWIGNIVYTINTGTSFLRFDALNFDISLLLLFISYTEIIESTQMILFALLGWTFASLWAKHYHPQYYSNIMILSVLIPLLTLPAILLLVGLNFVLGTFEFAFGLILLLLLITLIFISIASLIVIVPGLIIASFINPAKIYKNRITSTVNYLGLVGPIPPTPNEALSYCIFRMKSSSGCAYLGYEAPNSPLICDYESTWRSCYVYSHLYYKLEVIS